MAPPLSQTGQQHSRKYSDNSTLTFSHPRGLELTWTLNSKMELNLIDPNSTQCQRPTAWNSGSGSMKIWQLDVSTVDTPPGPPPFSSKRRTINSTLLLITNSSTKS